MVDYEGMAKQANDALNAKAAEIAAEQKSQEERVLAANRAKAAALRDAVAHHFEEARHAFDRQGIDVELEMSFDRIPSHGWSPDASFTITRPVPGSNQTRCSRLHITFDGSLFYANLDGVTVQSFAREQAESVVPTVIKQTFDLLHRQVHKELDRR